MVAHNKGGGPFLNGPWRQQLLTQVHEISGAKSRVAPAVLGLGDRGSTGGWRCHSRRAYFKNEEPGPQVRKKRAMRQFGPPPTLGELQRSTPWVWRGVSAANITRRWPARSQSSDGDTPQATSCARTHAALLADEKVRPPASRLCCCDEECPLCAKRGHRLTQFLYRWRGRAVDGRQDC